MKIIHQNGYSVDELTMYRLTIYKNVIDCAKALIAAMKQLEIEPELEANRDFSNYLENYSVDPDPETPLDTQVGQAVASIWRDPCIPKLMEHSTSFYLMDSAP
jgi:guanine nucleotide-binding protein G(i) subunit alpha